MELHPSNSIYLPQKEIFIHLNWSELRIWHSCLFICPAKSLDDSGGKELSEQRQRQAQMQTRLPARLAAPKLPSLAHVISLEQSREEGKRRGRLEPSVGAPILV